METPEKNRKRVQDLRWNAFQSILVGVVMIMVLTLFCFVYLYSDDTRSRPDYYSRGKALSFLLFIGVWGLWMIVRGVIYLIRLLSGNEQYGKSVEDVMDKSIESRYEAMMKKKVGNASTRNVAVLLGWVFLFLAIAGAIFFGYLILTRPR